MVVPSGPLAAIACIKGEGSLRGTVKFYPVDCGTLIAADVTGLPENESGFFALHIHSGENCEGKAFPNTGGHYDLEGNAHPDHAGDLPPLLSEQGRAFLAARTGRFEVWDIIGKTVVIHSGPDDFRSQPGGNAGQKLGCGEIKVY